MRTFDLNSVKQKIYDTKIAPRIENARINIRTIIDRIDPKGIVRIQGKDYLGTQAIEYVHQTQRVGDLEKINISDDQRKRIISYISIINTITKEWSVVSWYFARLARACSMGDVYRALPSSYHQMLPGKQENFSSVDDLYDQEAFEILEQLDLQMYLEK